MRRGRYKFGVFRPVLKLLYQGFNFLRILVCLLLSRPFENIICNIKKRVVFYILQRAVNRNVWKAVAKTHAKKLEMLTRNVVLPFKSTEKVNNLSCCSFTSDQRDILKFGLPHSICPPRIIKSDVFVCF